MTSGLTSINYRLFDRKLTQEEKARYQIGCWVDLETGRLGRGRRMSDLGDITLIPGTDRSFVGFQLPCWVELKEVALRTAAAFPWARAIGWDIATSERGPVLIEGNERWLPPLSQMPAPWGLLDGEFRALYEALRRGDGRGT